MIMSPQPSLKKGEICIQYITRSSRTIAGKSVCYVLRGKGGGDMLRFVLQFIYGSTDQAYFFLIEDKGLKVKTLPSYDIKKWVSNGLGT